PEGVNPAAAADLGIARIGRLDSGEALVFIEHRFGILDVIRADESGRHAVKVDAQRGSGEGEPYPRTDRSADFMAVEMIGLANGLACDGGLIVDTTTELERVLTCERELVFTADAQIDCIAVDLFHGAAPKRDSTEVCFDLDMRCAELAIAIPTEVPLEPKVAHRAIIPEGDLCRALQGACIEIDRKRNAAHRVHGLYDDRCFEALPEIEADALLFIEKITKTKVNPDERAAVDRKMRFDITRRTFAGPRDAVDLSEDVEGEPKGELIGEPRCGTDKEEEPLGPILEIRHIGLLR